MLVKSNFINPTERSASRVAEASDVKVSHSTSQNAKTVDVYWYVLNVCIGTGIFSLPSGIFAINGSVAITLFLWAAGAFIAGCGLCTFVELGLAMPRSGGEKNYLERIYRRPRYLVSCVVAAFYALFGGTPASALAFGAYILRAAGYADAKERWESRAIAIGCVTFVTILHALQPRWGLRAIKLLAYYKLILLCFIICTGFAALAGRRNVADPHNFDNAFTIGNKDSDGYGSGGIYGYATILIRLGYAYGGAGSVTTILGEFRNPQRALSVAAPLALGTVAILYLLVNIAYFAAIPKAQFANADVIITATFFENVFGGSKVTQVLSVLVAVGNLGNILAISFDTSRMIQELAKEGVLPFSHFWASDKPSGAPTAALFLCWVSTVVLLVAPPPGPIYNFLIDSAVYPRIVLSTLVSCGLLYLRLCPRENWVPTFKMPMSLLLFWTVYHIFVTVMPLVPSACNTSKCVPQYMAPLLGICILASGAVYWIFWAKVLPKLRGYKIVPTRIARENGAEIVEFRKIWTAGNLNGNDTTAGTS